VEGEIFLFWVLVFGLRKFFTRASSFWGAVDVEGEGSAPRPMTVATRASRRAVVPMVLGMIYSLPRGVGEAELNRETI
jgi:hypothetical protein